MAFPSIGFENRIVVETANLTVDVLKPGREEENPRPSESNHSCINPYRLNPSYNFLSSQMISHAELMRLIISHASRT